MKNIKKVSVLLAIILTVSTSLVGCNNKKDNETSSSNMSEVIENQSSAVNEFTTKDIDGVEVTEKIFSDYDLTMVNLWTTTCGYCIEEMPYLEEIRSEMQANGTKFNIVGICLDAGNPDKVNEKRIEKINDIIKKTNIKYPILYSNNEMWGGYLKDVSAVPETFFVDKDGNVVGESHLGIQTKSGWEDIINKELSALEK
ncbi:MAG: TlpA disulfide reductase family protein [Oscillospiraceae bacterium]